MIKIIIAYHQNIWYKNVKICIINVKKLEDSVKYQNINNGWLKIVKKLVDNVLAFKPKTLFNKNDWNKII